MHKHLIPLAVLLAAAPAHPQASANVTAGRVQPSPLAPSEIVAAAPKSDWSAISASDLLVMDLAPGAKGPSSNSGPHRVVIQLMPAPFSQGWVGNVRKLAAARFWDGLSINRVQDNYVVQWGDGNGENKAKARKLPSGLAVMPEADYVTRQKVLGGMDRLASRPELGDPYAAAATNLHGWPVASDGDHLWPVHCYGMVGVGRDLSPDTGSGAELYTVIGHAPRHLDRNIALVGRVIEGIEHLSSLPRGTEALGFYKTPAERTGITSVRIGTDVSGLPAYEYLSTESESFARYADARANRRDAFFIRPAGGADVCNIPVPVRRAK